MFLIFVIPALLASCSGQDPCTSATNIGNPRRSILYVPDDNTPLLTDDLLNTSHWFKLESYAGSKMPEFCISELHCGTAYPVWINGRHPTANDSDPIDVSVCATAGNNCCFWNSTIWIQRCEGASGSEFFVYKLVRTRQNSAYCAGDNIVCHAGHTWNNITQLCQENPTITNPPILGAPYISNSTVVSNGVNATVFAIDCNTNHPHAQADDGIRYKVAFKMNDDIVDTSVIKSTDDSVVTLGEEKLQGHIGKTLVCLVSAFIESYHPDPEESHPVPSNAFLFTLLPVDESGADISEIRIPVGSRFLLRFKPTFPITTGYCYHNPQDDCNRIHNTYEFQFVTDGMASYSNCKIMMRHGEEFSSNLSIVSATQHIGPVYSAGRITFVKFDDVRYIFNNYKIDDIPIIYDDGKKKPQCWCQSDPHLTTFAGVKFDVQLADDFYLVQPEPNTLLEIQARFISCSNSFPNVKCTCGVIAREGNNILGINFCDNLTQPLSVQYLLDEHSSGGKIVRDGINEKIILPSGVTIAVDSYMRADSTIEWLNVYITGLNDVQYEGICSNRTTATDSMSRYRVPESESFFRLSESNPPKCKNFTQLVSECNCGGSNDGDVNCEIKEGAPVLRTRYACVDDTSRRISTFEESGGIDYISLDYLNSKIDHSKDTLVETVNRDWPTPTGITQQQATDRCTDFFRSSPSYSTCANYTSIDGMVHSCTLDIQFTDDLNSTSYSESVFENGCINAIQSSIRLTDDEPDPGTKDLIDKVESVQRNLCPSACQNGGSCINSTCICPPDYFGGDCSLTEGQPPTVHELISNLCDIRESPCRTIYVNALHVLNSDKLSCKYESSLTGVQYSSGLIMFGNLVYCTLPSNSVRALDDTAATVYTVAISISNDQLAYSNSKPFTVFDSRCMACEADGSNCQQTPATCAIRGRCFTNGETCQFDSNKVCDSSKCATKWSTPLTSSCVDGDDVCVYIEPSATTPTTTTTTTITTTTTTTRPANIDLPNHQQRIYNSFKTSVWMAMNIVLIKCVCGY